MNECRQMDFWPERADRRSVSFSRLAFRAAAPRPELCEDAGAAASESKSKALFEVGMRNENYKDRMGDMATAAPLGNHGENYDRGLL